MQSYTTHLRTLFSGCLLALGLWERAAAQTPTLPLGSYTAVIPQDVRVGNLTFLSGESQLTLLTGGKYQLGRNNYISYRARTRSAVIWCALPAPPRWTIAAAKARINSATRATG